MHLNGSNSNSTHALEETAISPQVPLFHNGSDSITSPAADTSKDLDSVVNFTARNDGSPVSSVQGREINLTSQGASSPQPMVPLPNRTSLDSETDSRSPVVSVTSAATSVSKDGNSGSLPGNSNLTSNNVKPVTAKNSKKRPSKVVSISEMNLLLQHNHASSKLAVCFG